MERKKQTTSAKTPVVSITDGKSVYIRQPYPISAMQADLSKQQIRILVGMMQSIQDGVQRMFERGANENNQLLLFPDMVDDHVNIDFKFSDVAVRPDAYRDVADIADKFMHMVFSYEDKELGEVTLKHFVDEVTYPKRGSKRDKIRFSFTRKQAEVVFNFTMYSRYLLSVAAEAESKHTARIYMLITSARGFDTGNGIFHWYVTYEELRRMLGCDEKDEHGHWKRKRQKLYKHFKADVLRVAENELKQLADNGKCDCWFEFTELPEDFTGEPQRFDFVVHAMNAVGTKMITVEPDSPKRRGRKPGKTVAAVEDTDPLLVLLRSLDIKGKEPEKLMAQMQDHRDALMAEARRLHQYYAECRAGLHPEQAAITNYGGNAKVRLQDFINRFQARLQTAEPSLAFSDAPAAPDGPAVGTATASANPFNDVETW